MLPFNIISEVSRTLALAVRLVRQHDERGNDCRYPVTIVPFIFPIIMTAYSVFSPAWCRPTSSAFWQRFTSRPPREFSNLSPNPQQNIETNSNIKENSMDDVTIIAVASIVMAGITTGIGSMGPSLAKGARSRAALSSLAQQPDASATITRTLFVGLAMIESTAIYCFVVSMILSSPTRSGTTSSPSQGKVSRC
jgi:F-type H+-transporting ATPase subunit c